MFWAFLWITLYIQVKDILRRDKSSTTSTVLRSQAPHFISSVRSSWSRLLGYSVTAAFLSFYLAPLDRGTTCDRTLQRSPFWRGTQQHIFLYENHRKEYGSFFRPWFCNMFFHDIKYVEPWSDIFLRHINSGVKAKRSDSIFCPKFSTFNWKRTLIYLFFYWELINNVTTKKCNYHTSKSKIFIVH